MSTMNQEYFARKLAVVHDYFQGPNFDVEHYSKKVMQAFLFFGSDTPDNQNCMEAVHYGSAMLPENPSFVGYGFRLRQKPIFVQDILSVVRLLSIPQPIAGYYPALTEIEWKAALLTAIKMIEAFSPRQSKTRELGWNVASEYFARKLWSVYDSSDFPDFDVVKFNYRIMEAFRQFNHIHPDNKQAYELIEYGQAQLPHWKGVFYGFKIKGKPIRVVELMNELEALPMPDKIAEIFPDLLPNELAALLRMATMIVLAFSPTTHVEPE